MERSNSVQLTGNGKLEEHLFDLDEVNLLAVPDLVKEAEAKANELKMENAKFFSMWFEFTEGKVKIHIFVNGDRQKGELVADNTGKIIEPFRIR